MKRGNLFIGILALFCFNFSEIVGQVIKDIDGNTYPTTTIGRQIWMVENLKTTKYNDGKVIPLITDDKAWQMAKSGAYCLLNNDNENKELYGLLYNWYAVNTKKLCPKGWHIPSDSEWSTLLAFLGDENKAGDKLKEAGMTHWNNSMTKATNDYDFTALPGGWRHYRGDFPPEKNAFAVWWSATTYDESRAWTRGLYFRSSQVFKGFDLLVSGFSVRCLKDQ